MSEVWKCVFFVALCWTSILNTRSYEIIQCSSMYLDTPLCSFNKVANITRVYGGGRPDDSKDCFRTSGDCFLEINSTSVSSTYNEIINNCNGTSACRKPLYVYKGERYECSGQWIFIKYLNIEYDCIHPNTVMKYTTQCPKQYASHPRCPVGKRIAIGEVFGGVNRVSVNSSERCRTSPQDCVSLVQSKDKEDIKDKCEGKIACDQLFIKDSYIVCGGTMRYWTMMHYVIIQYHCVEYGADYYLTCASNLENMGKTTISCPGNDINIKINDIWLGFGDHNSCNEFDLMTTKCLRTPFNGLSEVKRKCDGKKFCEIDFMKGVWCNREAFTANDYMLTLYECRSGHLGQSTEVMTTSKPSTEITDVIQPTTGTLVTGDDRVINSNEASNGRKMENVKRVTFIVIPIVVVIGLVIPITTAILLYKKRKQRKGTVGFGDGQSQVNANALTRTAVQSMRSKHHSDEMSETSLYSHINNQEDDKLADGNRVPVYENNDFVSGLKSNEDNKASNVTETYAVVDKTKMIKSKTKPEPADEANLIEAYAVVDKTKKIKFKAKPEPVDEANLTEVYAVVDKTKKIKSKADVKEVSSGLNVLETYVDIDKEKISKSKPEADCEPNLYASVDNRGSDDSGVQPNAEGKHKRHSSVEDTVIVDNLLYGKKESL